MHGHGHARGQRGIAAEHNLPFLVISAGTRNHAESRGREMTWGR